MARYKLICDHSCDLDTHVVTHEFDAEVLDDVLDNFKQFLMGAGFTWIDGELQLVKESPTEVDYSDHGGGSTIADYPNLMTKSRHSSRY